MPKIFVSYRRGGAKARTYRMADELRRQFGKENVFLDVDSINPGVKFADRIQDSIQASAIALIMIGPKWENMTCGKGKRRLEDENDHLRVEVETALKSDATVIPVLVDGATMPAAENLPPAIAELTEINAMTLTDSHWDYDVKQLIGKIDPNRNEARHVVPERPAQVIEQPVVKEPISKMGIASLVLLTLVVFGIDFDYPVYSEFLGGLLFSLTAMGLSVYGYIKTKPKGTPNKVILITGMVLGGLFALSCYGYMDAISNFYDPYGY